MSKDIMAAVEEYQNSNNETKKRWTKIVVILSNDNGEYCLIDPTVNLAGVLIKQRLMSPQKASGSVIASIFDNDQQSGGQRQQSNNNQSQPSNSLEDDMPF